jgi:hypothetical protein
MNFPRSTIEEHEYDKAGLPETLAKLFLLPELEPFSQLGSIRWSLSFVIMA